MSTRNAWKVWGMAGFGLMLLATACGSPLQYIPQSTTTYPPTGAPSAVAILLSDPPGGRPYEVLGVIDWLYYQPNWRPPIISDAMPDLKQKAWEVGGHAIIVRQAAGGMTDRTLHILAEVIRFKDEGSQPRPSK